MLRMATLRRVLAVGALALVALTLGAPTTLAQDAEDAAAREPEAQIVLSGSVIVPRGRGWTRSSSSTVERPWAGWRSAT